MRLSCRVRTRALAFASGSQLSQRHRSSTNQTTLMSYQSTSACMYFLLLLSDHPVLSTRHSGRALSRFWTRESSSFALLKARSFAVNRNGNIETTVGSSFSSANAPCILKLANDAGSDMSPSPRQHRRRSRFWLVLGRLSSVFCRW